MKEMNVMAKTPEAGWYPDPENPDMTRYWDGKQWTDARQAAPKGAATMDGRGLASFSVRRDILSNLRDTGGKYTKPFERGQLANLSILGGDWNDYAQIVMNMVIADTLMNIERELTIIRERTEG